MHAIPPFLPEDSAPEAAPAQSKSTKKTLVLWVVLIFALLVVWQFLSPPSSPHGGDVAMDAPCVEPSSFHWWNLATVAFPVVAIFFFFRVYGATTTFQRSQEPGSIALAHRRFSEAAAAFRASEAAVAKKPTYLNVVRANIGWAELWSGHLRESIAAFSTIEQQPGFLFRSGIRTHAAVNLAFTYALAGDLDTSARWAAEARTRLAKTAEERLHPAARLRLAEAVLACRRGNAVEARTLLDTSWLDLRGTFDANLMRVAEIVRAFAEAHGDVREQNVVAERLIRVEPAIGNEFAFLGKAWPEMQTFLLAHRLVSPV